MDDPYQKSRGSGCKGWADRPRKKPVNVPSVPGFPPIANPLRYTAREFDQETGIYENRHRYYDPNVGRFLSEDPIKFRGGVNFYAYTRNNPVTLTDPFGYQECDAMQWAQSPNACAGPQDSDSPYLGPDGLWYNVPTFSPPADPTPTIPSAVASAPPPPRADQDCRCKGRHNIERSPNVGDLVGLIYNPITHLLDDITLIGGGVTIGVGTIAFDAYVLGQTGGAGVPLIVMSNPALFYGSWQMTRTGFEKLKDDMKDFANEECTE